MNQFLFRVDRIHVDNRKPPLQGPKYFIYEGETLEDRRNRLEGVGKAVTPKTNNWIIACNKTYYDIERALTELKTIDYKQTANIQAGSKIYLYISSQTDQMIRLKQNTF